MKVFFLLLAIGLVFSLQTGFKTTVSQAGLNYLKDVGFSILEKKFSTVVIPDQSGEVGTPIGKVDWQLNNMVLTDIQFPQTTITVLPNSGMKIAVLNAGAHFTCEWHYRKKHWPHISDHGSADISVAQLSVQLTITMSLGSNGLPVVSVASDSADIGSIDIKLHGGASWLYNIFIGLLKGDIKKAIVKGIEQGVVQGIDNGLNKALAKLPINQPVNHEVEIDLALTSAPVFGNSYFTLPQLGEFYSIGNPSECPSQFCPPATIPDEVSQNMVQMMIGDFVANSAGYVFYNRGDLKGVVTNAQIPVWSPVNLNTSTWKLLVPALYELYPNRDMVSTVQCSSPPTLAFTTSGMHIQSPITIEMQVQFENGTLVEAFTLDGDVDFQATITINGANLEASIAYLTGNFTVASSNVGPLQISLLVDLIDLAINKGLVPAFNSLLAGGFPLPVVAGVTFINPTLNEFDGYLGISTSIQYTPPNF